MQPKPAKPGNIGLCLLIAALISTAAMPAGAQNPAATPDITGIWIDETGKGAIELVPCSGDRVCGCIVWLQQPLDKSGKPLTDGYNPVSAQRQRSICGLQVIGELKRVGSATWDNGWIYDPKEGKSYDVEIKPRGADKLMVTGYIGVKFLSETFVWTRAPANLPRCDTGPAASGSQATTVR